MSIRNQRHKRYTAHMAAWASWEDEKGVQRRAIGRCLDLSMSGTRLELFASLEPGKEVTVGIPRMDLTLKAVVRSCRPNGSKHSIGLEFLERLSKRYTAHLAAWASWEDEKGYQRRATGRYLDISISRIRLELFASLELGKEVTVGIPRMDIAQKAVVQSCRPSGSKHLIDLEFQERLLNPKQSAIGHVVTGADQQLVPEKPL